MLLTNCLLHTHLLPPVQQLMAALNQHCYLDVTLLLLQGFTQRMYELIKGQLGVTEELPGSSSKQEGKSAAAAADEETAEDAAAEESDKSEL
jgi:hypothetical protein